MACMSQGLMLLHPVFHCYLLVSVGKPRFLVGRVRLRFSYTKRGPCKMLQEAQDLGAGILETTSALEVPGTSRQQT